MSTMSYISVIERYRDYRVAIHELLASILSGVAEERLVDVKSRQVGVMQMLGGMYPFVDLLYLLNADGIQTSDYIGVTKEHPNAYTGRGKDRSQRPYFKLAKAADNVVVTEPYLSSASRKLCVSAAIRFRSSNGDQGYLVLDIDLAAAVEFLMGDTARRRFQPLFRGVYASITAGLFVVVAALLYSGFQEIAQWFATGQDAAHLTLKPFSVIIFLTLALAVFDLGKTTLEEEVLMHKDIFRHSSTRRTITRFMAAILIAVSIEALLLMFKAALGGGEHLVQAVWMMLGAVGLLIGLGVYVFLGAQAEALLLKSRR